MTSHSRRGGARETSATHRFLRSPRGRAATTATDVRLTLPAQTENIPVIRHVLGAFAESLRLPADVVEDMRLAVTEACTNVVRHAYDDGDTGTIDVVMQPHGDRLDVTVSDRGRGMGPSPDIDGPGLGLPLIAALADSIEVDDAPIRGNRLKMSFASHSPLGVA